MLDPLTTSVVIILGKYALDKGATLVTEVGPKALEIAKEMFTDTLDYLRRKPDSKQIADEFQQDPESYEKPIQQKLETAIQNDSQFKAQLQALKARYDEAVRTRPDTPPTIHVQVGSGAAAVGRGNIVLGERAVYTGGTVGGNIITGDGKQ